MAYEQWGDAATHEGLLIQAYLAAAHQPPGHAVTSNSEPLLTLQQPPHHFILQEIDMQQLVGVKRRLSGGSEVSGLLQLGSCNSEAPGHTWNAQPVGIPTKHQRVSSRDSNCYIDGLHQVHHGLAVHAPTPSTFILPDCCMVGSESMQPCPTTGTALQHSGNLSFDYINVDVHPSTSLVSDQFSISEQLSFVAEQLAYGQQQVCYADDRCSPCNTAYHSFNTNSLQASCSTAPSSASSLHNASAVLAPSLDNQLLLLELELHEASHPSRRQVGHSTDRLVPQLMPASQPHSIHRQHQHQQMQVVPSSIDMMLPPLHRQQQQQQQQQHHHQQHQQQHMRSRSSIPQFYEPPTQQQHHQHHQQQLLMTTAPLHRTRSLPHHHQHQHQHYCTQPGCSCGSSALLPPTNTTIIQHHYQQHQQPYHPPHPYPQPAKPSYSACGIPGCTCAAPPPPPQPQPYHALHPRSSSSPSSSPDLLLLPPPAHPSHLFIACASLLKATSCTTPALAEHMWARLLAQRRKAPTTSQCANASAAAAAVLQQQEEHVVACLVWVAAKLEENRRSVLPTRSYAAAVRVPAGRLAVIELVVMHALQWCPYTGWLP